MNDEYLKDFDGFSPNVQQLYRNTGPCHICPRNCKIKRDQGQLGYCGIGLNPIVSSVAPHFGEESCLVGKTGSGTIFFAGCNLSCIFCQNFDISHQRFGSEMTVEDLAQKMLDLQNIRCCNINLVTPTHLAAPAAAAIELARSKGLDLPIVYNTGGYDSVETLKLLEPFIDIYMPDIKYSDPDIAGRLSDADDYPQVAFAAVAEMHRQKGDLHIENGIAQKGLLVRHLVLPDNLAGSFKVIDFLAEHISTDTHINILAQYRPCYKADEHPSLKRSPSWEEIKKVNKYARQKSLTILKD